jgi:ferric-dicitrate binding protein FerR (iron transport regulator)
MEIPEQIWLLIARNLSGEASEPEQKELAEILRNDEQLHQHYDLLTRVWADKQGSLQSLESAAAKNIVSRIITRASTDPLNIEEVPVVKPSIRRLRVWMAVASVVVMVFAGWLWLGNKSVSASQPEPEHLEAQRGSRTQSVLPDGSKVWLNAGSKLYYENDFTGSTREVRLEGEAYFDIVKKEDRPFIVHTSGIDIKVLGTAFNVKSYPEDKTVETTLFRGSVKVFRHTETEAAAVHLKPNEKLTLLKEAAGTTENLSPGKTLSPGKITPAISGIDQIDSTKKEDERIETAWVYDRLEFVGLGMEELAIKLERWYNIRITFKDEGVKNLSFTGTFKPESLEQAFAYLKVANPLFDYKINNSDIIVGLSK